MSFISYLYGDRGDSRSARLSRLKRLSRPFKLAVVFLLLGMLSARPALCGEPTATTSEPTRVEVGIWFNDIHSIDFVNGSFGAEFYIWWVSPDPDLEPFEIFQVLNGRDWTVKSISKRKLPDGTFHTSGIVSVTVNHDWQLLYFPFDRQDLKIILETAKTVAELRLVPNKSQSIISDFMHVEGFQVTGLDVDEKTENYKTDFGIKADAGNQFSRLIITIGMERESQRLVVAMLIGFIVANIIALLTYFIHVSNLGIRVSMVGSAIFGAVGNMYSLNSTLNPAVGSMLVDRFAVGTFSAIVIALLNAIVVERLAQHGKSRLAHQVNRFSFATALIASIVFYTVAFYVAISGSA